MAVQSIRPDVSALSFMLYDRAMHPELFEGVCHKNLSTPTWAATISICHGGHVAAFRTLRGQLTEVAGHPTSEELPTRGQKVNFRIQAGREATIELPGPIRVHFSSHVDTVDPAVFTELNEELVAVSSTAWMAYSFQSAQRLRPQPLSIIQVDAQPSSLLVNAFHTFPDNFAVLRTQSLYEIDGE